MYQDLFPGFSKKNMVYHQDSALLCTAQNSLNFLLEEVTIFIQPVSQAARKDINILGLSTCIKTTQA